MLIRSGAGPFIDDIFIAAEVFIKKQRDVIDIESVLSFTGLFYISPLRKCDQETDDNQGKRQR